MGTLFSPPYFSPKVRAGLVWSGFFAMACAAYFSFGIRGGSISMALIFFYAALATIITGSASWQGFSLSYAKHPISYFVMLFFFIGFGLLFLFI